jgi:hypothetical protein
MPPQAAPKSPEPKDFSSGGQGEWSDTTQSIAPPSSPRHSASRLTESLIGGQDLNSVAPSGTCSAAKYR